MSGKIRLITGATNGIGKASAQALANMGATVVIVGRNAPKTAQLVEDIRTASGNQNVDSLLADLSSQHDIRRIACELKNKYPHLHVLLNNAGGTDAFQFVGSSSIHWLIPRAVSRKKRKITTKLKRTPQLYIV